MNTHSNTSGLRRVLVVDTDAVYRAGLEEPLAQIAWEPAHGANANEAWQALERGGVHALWIEQNIPPDEGAAAELLHRVHRTWPKLPILVVIAEVPELAGTKRRPLRRTQPSSLPSAAKVFTKRDSRAAVDYLAGLGIGDLPELACGS